MLHLSLLIHVAARLNVNLPTFNVLNPVVLVINVSEVVNFGLLPLQVGEEISHSAVFLNQSFELDDIFLVELNLPFHILEVS